MKRKILYIAATAAIATTAFFVGKFAATTPTETITIEKEVVPENYIDLDNVRGWEHWKIRTRSASNYRQRPEILKLRNPRLRRMA